MTPKASTNNLGGDSKILVFCSAGCELKSVLILREDLAEKGL